MSYVSIIVDGKEIERVHAGLYKEWALRVSKEWLETFEANFAERGFLEKTKTRDDYLIWLVQVGLNESGSLGAGVDSPWH